MKLVPGLNILSTVYDVIDTAITAADLYDQIRSSQQIFDEAIKIKPNFSVVGEDGSLTRAYDF